MKFLYTLAVAVAVTSVNAAVLVARAVRPEVQLCLDDITAAQNQLSVVTTGVTNWTVASGYLGALAVQAEEQELEALLATAGEDCCVPIADITEEEAQAVLSQMSSLMPLVTNTLDVIITRKPDFDSVPLVTNLVKTDIVALRGLTDTVAHCLLDVTPEEHKDEADGYYETIDNAFTTAYTAYDL